MIHSEDRDILGITLPHGTVEIPQPYKKAADTIVLKPDGENYELDLTGIGDYEGQNIEIIGDDDLMQALKKYFLSEEGRYILNECVVRVTPDSIYITYSLDNQDHVIATLHLSLEGDKWNAFLTNILNFGNANNFFWLTKEP